MLNQQWVKVLQQLAPELGVPEELRGTLTYNSMRRFMPTLAQVLGYPLETRQAIGSWQEVPQGQDTHGRAVQAMANHYSDEKALASGEAKRVVLQHFIELSMTCRPVQNLLAGGQDKLGPDTLTWARLASLTIHQPPPPPPQGVLAMREAPEPSSP